MSIITSVYQQGVFMGGPQAFSASSVSFALNTPAVDGEVMVFWVWNGRVSSIYVEAAPVSYILDTNPSANVGTSFFSGQLCFVRLSQNDQKITINVTANFAGRPYLLDLWTLRHEARIPELYVYEKNVVGAGVVLKTAAFTLPVLGNAIISAFNDTLGLVVTPGYYSYLNTTNYLGFDYASCIVLGQPAGTTAAEPWISPPTTVQGTVNLVQATCIDLAVESGLAYVDGGATVQVPQAGAQARYINPVPDTLHAVPPTPSKIVVPTPPWVQRPGQPYRKGVT